MFVVGPSWGTTTASAFGVLRVSVWIPANAIVNLAPAVSLCILRTSYIFDYFIQTPNITSLPELHFIYYTVE
jgi:hypothetical protein